MHTATAVRMRRFLTSGRIQRTSSSDKAVRSEQEGEIPLAKYGIFLTTIRLVAPGVGQRAELIAQGAAGMKWAAGKLSPTVVS
jgi:hypothetical protein